MSALDSKTFVLGIGAQKAGTTWLHDYLANRSEVWSPPIKEMHVLDVLFRPDLSIGFKHRALRQLRQYLLETDEDIEYTGHLSHLIDRVRAQAEKEAYQYYFAKRVSEQKLFMDITPSYSTLPEEAFAFVKTQFPRCKIIYLLRDPVERYFSALRMRERKTDGEFDARHNFRRWLTREAVLERSAYHLTYQRVLSEFSRDEIFVGFYETFFCDGEIRRLCEFLAIPFAPGNYSDIRNASAPRRSVDPSDWQAARDAFADVYAFCRKEFGSAVPDAWNSSCP